MKKKGNLPPKDKKDWEDYISNPLDIIDKDFDNKPINKKKNRFKFDLHGYGLNEANIKVKEIILFCHKKKYSEVLFITGKGLHSNSDKNIYESEKFSKLKHSVPNFIQTEASLSNFVKEIETADKNEGGEGAILVKLRL